MPIRHPQRNLRQQLFVAPRAQGRLLFRIAIYCVASSLATAMLCFAATYNAADAWESTVWLRAIVLTLILVIPIVMYDAARASNRIVGPFARVQRAVRQLSNGDAVSPIRVRDGDLYWEDWMQDFNQMLVRLQSRRQVTSAVAAEVEGESE